MIDPGELCGGLFANLTCLSSLLTPILLWNSLSLGGTVPGCGYSSPDTTSTNPWLTQPAPLRLSPLVVDVGHRRDIVHLQED